MGIDLGALLGRVPGLVAQIPRGQFQAQEILAERAQRQRDAMLDQLSEQLSRERLTALREGRRTRAAARRASRGEATRTAARLKAEADFFRSQEGNEDLLALPDEVAVRFGEDRREQVQALARTAAGLRPRKEDEPKTRQERIVARARQLQQADQFRRPLDHFVPRARADIDAEDRVLAPPARRPSRRAGGFIPGTDLPRAAPRAPAPQRVPPVPRAPRAPSTADGAPRAGETIPQWLARMRAQGKGADEIRQLALRHGLIQ